MTVSGLRYAFNQNHFNSHPHEEDDNVRHSNAHIHQHFNSHPHEEDDVEESRNCRTRKHFNSHPHEEDDSNFKQK